MAAEGERLPRQAAGLTPSPGAAGGSPRLQLPRRQDRGRGEEWIRSFLHDGEVAVLAGIRGGRPACLPRLYAFDEPHHALYLHGAHGGEVQAILRDADDRQGAGVALTVFRIGRFLPAEEAAEFSVEYASVVVEGRLSLVEEELEALHGLQLLMAKYAPHLRSGVDYRSIRSEEVERTAVLRLDIEAWSGKEKVEKGDRPDAYRWSDVRRRRERG